MQLSQTHKKIPNNQIDRDGAGLLECGELSPLCLAAIWRHHLINRLLGSADCDPEPPAPINMRSVPRQVAVDESGESSPHFIITQRVHSQTDLFRAHSLWAVGKRVHLNTFFAVNPIIEAYPNG